MALIRPTGMIPGFMTAFTEDYKLDEERFKQHLRFVINIRHVGGVAITAGAGEHFALEFEEFKRCQELAVEVAKGKVHVWTNLGAESMTKTIRLADAARDAGVDGLRIIHPYYSPYDPASLYQYYRDLAKRYSDMPVMIYPQTKLNNRPFPVDVMMRLADIDNIVGVKLGSDYGYGELLRLHAYTAGKDFAIVSGGLHEFYLMCRSGIQTKAAIGPLPQVAPEISSRYWETVVSGKWDDALVQLREIYDFYQVLLLSPNFWGGFKYALKLLGRDIGPCRLPISMPNPAEQERIRTALTKAGLLTPLTVAA